MNESNGRKTLISVKVSTLLLILLAIIILIVIGIVIANNSKKNEEKELDNSQTTNTEIDELEATTEENLNEQTSYNRNVSVSSRSSAPRETMQVVLSEGSNVEIIQEKPEVAEEPQTEPEVVTTPIEEVTISKDMDLTVRTGLSRDDFILLISEVEEDTSNFFEENAGLIYDICEKYSLNEIFFCGLISAESGWTIATNHRNTHNYISLMSGKGLIKFESVESGLEKAAETLHNNYLFPGGKFYYGSTLTAMKTKFCPASSNWVNLVYQRMSQILN